MPRGGRGTPTARMTGNFPTQGKSPTRAWQMLPCRSPEPRAASWSPTTATESVFVQIYGFRDGLALTRDPSSGEPRFAPTVAPHLSSERLLSVEGAGSSAWRKGLPLSCGVLVGLG